MYQKMIHWHDISNSIYQKKKCFFGGKEMTTFKKKNFSHCKTCDYLKDGSCKGDTVTVWIDEVNNMYLIDPLMPCGRDVYDLDDLDDHEKEILIKESEYFFFKGLATAR